MPSETVVPMRGPAASLIVPSPPHAITRRSRVRRTRQPVPRHDRCAWSPDVDRDARIGRETVREFDAGRAGGLRRGPRPDTG
jgi:hypothetical protein